MAVERIRTEANSAATKKPFKTTEKERQEEAAYGEDGYHPVPHGRSGPEPRAREGTWGRLLGDVTNR